MTMANGRPSGRVRMSRSMWRRSVAIPNRPRPASAKKISASARPWLVLPPANWAIELTAAPKLAGVDHGVPVCRDWKTNVGSQGSEREHPDRAGDQTRLGSGPPLRASPPRLPDQPERHGPDQVDRPVVGVEEQGDDGADRDQVPRSRSHQRPVEGEEPGHGQERDQGVHPRFGVVADGERRRGDEEHGRPADGATAEPASGQPGEWHGRHPDHARQGAHRKVRRPERAHPEVEEDVEERRGPVPTEERGEVVERLAGDVDGQRLVEPEVRPRPESEDEARDEDHPGGDHEQADRPFAERPPLRIGCGDGGAPAGSAPPGALLGALRPRLRRGAVGRFAVPDRACGLPRTCRSDRPGLRYRGGPGGRCVHGPNGIQAVAQGGRVRRLVHHGPWAYLAVTCPPKSTRL